MFSCICIQYFDSMPEGVEDVSTYPDLIAAMVKQGWSAEDLQKVIGENLIRVFKEVEKVRQQNGNVYIKHTTRSGKTFIRCAQS